MTSATEGTTGAISAGRGDNRREGVGVEAGAADESPVDVLLAEQLTGVLRLHGAAVEDPQPVDGRAPHGEQVADEGTRLLGLPGGRRAPGADRPDRLVGDDDRAQVPGLDPLEVGAQLALEHRLGLARVARLLALADAEDRLEAGRERRRDLPGKRLVG